MSRPVYSLPEPDRSEAVRALAGRIVTIEHQPLALVSPDSDVHQDRGRLVGVADRHDSGFANLAILDETGRPGLVAVALSEIHSVVES